MAEQQLTRKELKDVYAFEGMSVADRARITRADAEAQRALLRKNFIEEIDFNKHDGSVVNVKGFVFDAPEPIALRFASLRRAFLSLIGEYRIFVISPHPEDERISIPLVVPSKICKNRQFAYCKCVLSSFAHIEPTSEFQGRFLIAEDIHWLGLEKFMLDRKPLISHSDINKLLDDIFKFREREQLYAFSTFLFSSPTETGRRGGNTLAPVHARHELCIEEKMLQDALMIYSAFLPTYLRGKRMKLILDYGNPFAYSQAVRSSALEYRFGSPAKRLVENRGRMLVRMKNRELNLSSNIIPIDVALFASLDEFVRTKRASKSILSFTDVPLMVHNKDIALDAAHLRRRIAEANELSDEIARLLFYSLDNYQAINDDAKLSAVRMTLRDVKRVWPNMQKLMLRGIGFDAGMISGLGEHISKLAYATMRARKLEPKRALEEARKLYIYALSKFDYVAEKKVALAAEALDRMEGRRRERMTAGDEKMIDDTILALTAEHPEGWTEQNFVEELSDRANQSASWARKWFIVLKNENKLVENPHGVYRYIEGLDD